MAAPVYIRLKQSIYVQPQAEIRLKDTAGITGAEQQIAPLKELVLHAVTPEDQNIVVIDAFMIVEQILHQQPGTEVQLIGPSCCVVHVEKHGKEPNPILISAIWILLFIGAAMAIMNFHFDVSMQSVQQKLHLMLTGREAEYPLWIQIPYSIGLGIGMILFFNHWFQKRFNEEPSPMEVEIFNYQEDLDHYVAIKENKVEKKDVDR
ncbi:stage V sporulation protein AA [Halobacillus kuroshimensis]|uniref:Stage V sporulation protein AA n=1 Tax=Halobacillus kuroshimensis TaxID=302481 RepID=A0ABS3DTR9_9BACI|nr:stage V sporulation protein AA [Halobacillus kuroshimensis]MBN8234754.1 stage V sporulation protein AA [Halobacillus kuroshimensis]